ncbi:MAG: hypothetical protein FJW31_18245, partial [Acidobacteria bacterium]|nr:hypothetical protein [Acidobacteriota bacterium]
MLLTARYCCAAGRARFSENSAPNLSRSACAVPSTGLRPRCAERTLRRRWSLATSTLQPLPLEPFRFYEYGKRRVHLDGCVEVEAAYYSVPPG